MEWVTIEGGPFWMGYSEQDLERAADERFGRLQKQVYSPTFEISKYPVTNRQFIMFQSETGIFSSPAILMMGDSLEEKLDHPVRFLCLYDALLFCTWAKCRLPTEVEWEKAARGRDGLRYSWGNEWEAGRCNGGNHGITTDTTPVTQFSLGVSPYGVMDMVGNIYELTSSMMVTSLNSSSELPREYVVLKGGTSYCSPQALLCANRYIHYPPNSLGDFVGFRCVKL